MIRDDKREAYISGCSHSSDHIKTSRLSRKLRHLCIINIGICSTKAKTSTETRDVQGEWEHSLVSGADNILAFSSKPSAPAQLLLRSGHLENITEPHNSTQSHLPQE